MDDKEERMAWKKTDMDLMTNIPYWLLNTRTLSKEPSLNKTTGK